MTHNITLKLADEQATLKLGADFARALLAGVNIYLHGDLGAGKTTLVRGVLNGLGFAGKVKSPTYTWVEPYQVRLNQDEVNLYHFDLYRIQSPQELYVIGLEEYFDSRSLVLVEWPEKGEGILPPPTLSIHLKTIDDSHRWLTHQG